MKNLDSDMIVEIIYKIIGRIESVGECYTDNERYENLEIMGKVVNELVYDIAYECRQVERYEGSMKSSGYKSIEILKKLKPIIDEALEEYDNE